MSGSSFSYMKSITVGELVSLLQSYPPDLIVQVPSLSRCKGNFIDADHIFVDTKEGYVSLDGDIAEACNE